MREFVLIIAFISGGLTLLGIYAFLEFSRGVAKSEIERATAIVSAVKDNGVSPGLTYWINVYYLKLIRRFRFLLGTSGVVFLIALAALYFYGGSQRL